MRLQKDLVAVMDVTPGTVSAWESGTYSPKLSTLCKISAYLEVPVDALLGLDADSSVSYTMFLCCPLDKVQFTSIIVIIQPRGHDWEKLSNFSCSHMKFDLLLLVIQ